VSEDQSNPQATTHPLFMDSERLLAKRVIKEGGRVSA
jgi:hypothetical protein